MFQSISKKQCVEFGLLVLIVLLYLVLRYKNTQLVAASFGAALVTLLVPMVWYPVAFVWFGMARALSSVGPVVILTVLFFVLVMPLGLLRRMLKHDALKLRQFKKGRQSVLVDRHHTYVAGDLKDTF